MAILGAIGGSSTITWLITFWANRKTNARKEDAAADSMEDENERKQVAWLEDRIAQRDAKIDGLYVEMRQEQKAHIDTIYKLHETELKLKDAEMRRCDVPRCANRQPPSDY
ncbi:MAG: hypothetical protein LUF01_14505 [Bacteroides sp.]|nr:hypothetical protein [Bacteroides sp.]